MPTHLETSFPQQKEAQFAIKELHLSVPSSQSQIFAPLFDLTGHPHHATNTELISSQSHSTNYDLVLSFNLSVKLPLIDASIPPHRHKQSGPFFEAQSSNGASPLTHFPNTIAQIPFNTNIQDVARHTTSNDMVPFAQAPTTVEASLDAPPSSSGHPLVPTIEQNVPFDLPTLVEALISILCSGHLIPQGDGHVYSNCPSFQSDLTPESSLSSHKPSICPHCYLTTLVDAFRAVIIGCCIDPSIAALPRSDIIAPYHISVSKLSLDVVSRTVNQHNSLQCVPSIVGSGGQHNRMNLKSIWVSHNFESYADLNAFGCGDDNETIEHITIPTEFNDWGIVLVVFDTTKLPQDIISPPQASILSTGIVILCIAPGKRIPSHFHRVMREFEVLLGSASISHHTSIPLANNNNKLPPRSVWGLTNAWFDQTVPFGPEDINTSRHHALLHHYDNPHPTTWTRVFCADTPVFFPQDEILFPAQDIYDPSHQQLADAQSSSVTGIDVIMDSVSNDVVHLDISMKLPGTVDAYMDQSTRQFPHWLGDFSWVRSNGLSLTFSRELPDNRVQFVELFLSLPSFPSFFLPRSSHTQQFPLPYATQPPHAVLGVAIAIGRDEQSPLYQRFFQLIQHASFQNSNTHDVPSYTLNHDESLAQAFAEELQQFPPRIVFTRNKYRGIELPGGKIDSTDTNNSLNDFPNDTPVPSQSMPPRFDEANRRALCRELNEECGLLCPNTSLLHVARYHMQSDPNQSQVKDVYLVLLSHQNIALETPNNQPKVLHHECIEAFSVPLFSIIPSQHYLAQSLDKWTEVSPLLTDQVFSIVIRAVQAFFAEIISKTLIKNR